MTEFALRDSLAAASEVERVEILTELLRNEIAQRLDIDPTQIELRGQLTQLGMSSLKAFELKLHLEEQLGFRLRSSVLFDYPTLETLVPFLLTKLSAGGAGLNGPALKRERLSAPEQTSAHATSGDASELSRELAALAQDERASSR